MGKRIEYIAGQLIGRCYYISEEAQGKEYSRYAKFKCECGVEFTSRILDVKFKNVSCGCAFRNKPYDKHGLTLNKGRTAEYGIWSGMKSRCYNTKSDFYYLYGGRGIRVCESWKKSFVCFLQDMGERSTPKHSIDRIDSNKDYCKENCKWSTDTEQANNTSRNVYYEYKGERLSIKMLAEKTGMSATLLHTRLRCSKWSVEKTLNTPIKL